MHSCPIQCCLMNLVITQFDVMVNSRTCVMKFKDFQALLLFSSTFKDLNLAEKNSSTFTDFQGCVGTLTLVFAPVRIMAVLMTWFRIRIRVRDYVSFPLLQ